MVRDLPRQKNQVVGVVGNRWRIVGCRDTNGDEPPGWGEIVNVSEVGHMGNVS